MTASQAHSPTYQHHSGIPAILNLHYSPVFDPDRSPSLLVAASSTSLGLPELALARPVVQRQSIHAKMMKTSVMITTMIAIVVFALMLVGGLVLLLDLVGLILVGLVLGSSKLDLLACSRYYCTCTRCTEIRTLMKWAFDYMVLECQRSDAASGIFVTTAVCYRFMPTILMTMTLGVSDHRLYPRRRKSSARYSVTTSMVTPAAHISLGLLLTPRRLPSPIPCSPRPTRPFPCVRYSNWNADVCLRPCSRYPCLFKKIHAPQALAT